jgi:hypothetical protein
LVEQTGKQPGELVQIPKVVLVFSGYYGWYWWKGKQREKEGRGNGDEWNK